jgi:hypothetical protein
MWIRKKLTFANVIACLALFIALGGVGYAATQLPKNSVGARELKRGAVTPPKLSPAAKKALAGSPGAQGLPGSTGPQGPEGKVGPQGPGAISFDIPVPATDTELKVIGGVRIYGRCTATETNLGVLPSPQGATLRASGKVFFNNSTVPIYEKASGGTIYGGGTNPIVIEAIARNEAIGGAYHHFNLALDSPDCQLRGFVTPSSAG